MKLMRLLPVVAAAGLLVAGCSPMPGTAATVDGEALSLSKVEAIEEGCRSIGIDDASLTSKAIVEQFINSRIFDEGAELVGMSNAEQLIDDAMEANAGAWTANEDCADFARFAIKSGSLGSLGLTQEQGEQLVGSLDLKVNPRFGHYDLENGTATESGSLSVLAGE